MKANNFKLFMGCLGHGITVCNSAVMEGGDYKTIAHISPAGNIKLYVKPDYIPADAMTSIENAAASCKADTIKHLELELSTRYGYERTIDQIGRYTTLKTFEQFWEDYKNAGSRADKVEVIKKYYLENF